MASFLSPAMRSETISVYDTYSFSHSVTAYKVLCLKEAQGFLFNQDLFASPYQQLRSAAQEKRLGKKRSKSLGHVERFRPKQRSYSFNPESAIAEGGDDENANVLVERQRSCRLLILEQFNTTFQRGLFAEISDDDMDIDTDEDAPEYSPIGSNHIPVVDICVQDNEPLIPSVYLDHFEFKDRLVVSEKGISSCIL